MRMFNFLALNPEKKNGSNSVSPLEQAEDVQDDPDLHDCICRQY